MATYDPSLDPANLPAANGQLPQIGSTTTTTSNQNVYGNKGQLSNQYLGNIPGSTVTNYTPVPGTGTFAPAAAAPSMSFDPNAPGNQPGMGENVSAAFLNHYADEGIPQNTNYAAQQYGQFQQQTPQDMSAYYDNASRNSANAINTQMAARGSYGSSNAVGVLSNAETNLRAQQAKDEASYGLQRAQLSGSLAAGADSSGRANSADERDWMSGLTDLGFKNQREEQARFDVGTRDLGNAAGIGAGIVDKTGNAQIDADRDLLIQSLMQNGMSYSDAVTAANNKVNSNKADEAQAVNYGTKALEAVAFV